METYKHTFTINSKKIGKNEPVFFIADIGANHDGDLGKAKELIYLAKNAGADAAKFQHFKASTIVSDYGFKNLGGLQSHQSSWNKSVYEIYDDASIDKEWTSELKKTCEEVDIIFFTSPYSFEMVDHIDPYVPAYKIGSGDITWIEMIEYIAAKGKPYILATGASTNDDVVRAVKSACSINPEFALLQCNTNYTGNLENFKYVHLNVLKTYREMYPDMILGLSDHTPGNVAVLGAVSLGARIIEKHFTYDTTKDGPDHHFALDPVTWREMVERTRELELALGSGIKKIEDNEKDTVIVQRRCIRLKNDLDTGALISKSDLTLLRPCPINAIQPYYLDNVIGKRVKISKVAGEHLEWTDIV